VSQEFLPFTRPSIDEQTIAGVAEVLRSGWITSGPQVQEFEVRLSAYFGGRPVRTLSSATGALEVGLALAGVGPGDEVITTPLSWVATANVIVRAGARPVFVDVDPQTRNIDLALLEAAITPLTRALLPVDLAGLPVDRSRLNAIARAHRLRNRREPAVRIRLLALDDAKEFALDLLSDGTAAACADEKPGPPGSARLRKCIRFIE